SQPHLWSTRGAASRRRHPSTSRRNQAQKFIDRDGNVDPASLTQSSIGAAQSNSNRRTGVWSAMPPFTQQALVDISVAQAEPSAIPPLANKRFPETVLLTDIRACADDHFVCVGRIPTDHRFFNDSARTPREDILFYTEVGRQASLAVTHAFLNVSLDDV